MSCQLTPEEWQKLLKSREVTITDARRLESQDLLARISFNNYSFLRSQFFCPNNQFDMRKLEPGLVGAQISSNWLWIVSRRIDGVSGYPFDDSDGLIQHMFKCDPLVYPFELYGFVYEARGKVFKVTFKGLSLGQRVLAFESIVAPAQEFDASGPDDGSTS
jgi:hypothetical protein